MAPGAETPGAPSSPRPGVLRENLDEGFLGVLLAKELGAQGLNILGPDKSAEAERGLRIPNDFTTSVQRREQVKVDFFKTEGASQESAAMIELRLIRALIAMNAALIERATQSGEDAARDAEALKAVLEHPNSVQVDVSFAGRRPVPAGFNQSLPGVLVMFLMLNLLFFGATPPFGLLRTVTIDLPVSNWSSASWGPRSRGKSQRSAGIISTPNLLRSRGLSAQ